MGYDDTTRLYPPVYVEIIDALSPLDHGRLADLKRTARQYPGRFAIVIDGMDKAGCEYVVFKAAVERCQAAGIDADIIIPAITSSGEGIFAGPDRIDWYSGPTLEQWLSVTGSRESI